MKTNPWKRNQKIWVFLCSNQIYSFVARTAGSKEIFGIFTLYKNVACCFRSWKNWVKFEKCNNLKVITKSLSKYFFQVHTVFEILINFEKFMKMGQITNVLLKPHMILFYICKRVLEIILAKNKNLMKDEAYFGTLNTFLFRGVLGLSQISMMESFAKSSNYTSDVDNTYFNGTQINRWIKLYLQFPEIFEYQHVHRYTVKKWIIKDFMETKVFCWR